MESRIYRFSVEELTYILAMSGHRDEARALLNSSFDEEINDDQLEQRMLTAAHGLMARGMLAVGGDASINLEQETAAFAKVLIDAKYSFRFSKIFTDEGMTGERAFSIHRSDDKWVEHTIEQGVVHQLEAFDDPNRLVGNAMIFFEPPRNLGSFTPFKLPGTALEVLTNPDPAIQHRLRQAGVPADLVPALAADATERRYQGSVMLVEYDEHRLPVSNHGLLMLQGQERLWLLLPDVQNGETILTVMAGDDQSFEAELRRLMSLRG